MKTLFTLSNYKIGGNEIFVKILETKKGLKVEIFYLDLDNKNKIYYIEETPRYNKNTNFHELWQELVEDIQISSKFPEDLKNPLKIYRTIVL